MKRLLTFLWGRMILFAIIAIGLLSTGLLNSLGVNPINLFQAENVSFDDMQARVQKEFDERQAKLDALVADAKKQSSKTLQNHIIQREQSLKKAQKRLSDAGQGPLASILPTKLVDKAKAEIEIAAINEELKVLKAALDPRQTLEIARATGVKLWKVPSAVEIENARTQCNNATKTLEKFKNRWFFDRLGRNFTSGEGEKLLKKQKDACANFETLKIKRDRLSAKNAEARKLADEQLQAQKTEAQQRLDDLVTEALPESAKTINSLINPRDIMIEALYWVMVITGGVWVGRALAYFLLAPLAARWPPMRFAPAGTAPPKPSATASAISLRIQLEEGEEALVRQDYLQSSSLTSTKEPRWLLDWRSPLTSFASGMRFLTAISGDGESLTVSAVKDPLAELAILKVPKGASCVLRPSALAAVVQPKGKPLKITSKWRFGLPAWLTWQWRYLIFHGPARLVVKGGRGVRIEAAESGRIVGEGQILGFSTNLAYSVIRSEIFWPYFFGREALLKDRVEEGAGMVLIEEAPMTGRNALRRGIDGVFDALLKVFGV